jgi:hypothetical protein
MLKKTLARIAVSVTVSTAGMIHVRVPNGPTALIWRCPLIAEVRKWLPVDQNGAFLTQADVRRSGRTQV